MPVFQRSEKVAPGSSTDCSQISEREMAARKRRLLVPGIYSRLCLRLMKKNPCSKKDMALVLRRTTKVAPFRSTIVSPFPGFYSEQTWRENEVSLRLRRMLDLQTWRENEVSLHLRRMKSNPTLFGRTNHSFVVSESRELVILTSRGIVVRAERFCQKGWFVASALGHYSWLISGASRRDRWFVAFALEHGY